MCINYISGLPSCALSRAEQLLKINLDIDVDVELVVNDQFILQRIVRQSARVSLGGIQKKKFSMKATVAVLQISHLHTDTD